MQGGKAPVAQRIEHQTSNLGVARSSRAGRTIKNWNKSRSAEHAKKRRPLTALLLAYNLFGDSFFEASCCLGGKPTGRFL